MTEHYTGYHERGPYPGEEPDVTRRQSGWLYIALGVAVVLTFVSVVLVATWPLAILAWALLAVLWTIELVAKRAAARIHHVEVTGSEREGRFVWDERTHPQSEHRDAHEGAPRTSTGEERRPPSS